jgi:hypothetical protein
MGQRGIKIRDVEHLKELLRNSPLEIKCAFLFGSRARGDWLEESDWDIIIVSPQFSHISFPERATLVLREIPLRRVELLCYTDEEFSEKVAEIGIVAEAAKGIRLL